MNKMNGKNNKAGCHCEENFSSTKQSSTPVLNQCVNNICTIGRKVEDCRVGVSHLLAMTRIGISLEKIFFKIFRDDLIYFKVAEILGSKLSFCPRMTEKWRCPRMTREVAEILGSCFASPRMTEKRRCPRVIFSTLTLAAVLSFSVVSDSWADAPAGCIGAEYLGCDWKCSSCEEGYELYDTCWFESCRKSCTSTQERVNGKCVDIPTCDKGGSSCRRPNGELIPNCCYKTEGDTTTLYPDDPEIEYKPSSDIAIPNNKKLVLSAGANDYFCPQSNTDYEEVYLPEGMNIPSICHCCYEIPSNLSVIVPDNVDMKNKIQNGFNIVCLGDVDKCKENVGSNYADRVVAPTESQCNTSGSYYYTGNSCEKRPEDPDDMVCRGGYAKLNNNCVDPLKTFAKKHYTPAEAAQWLKDKDNEITITFKK